MRSEIEDLVDRFETRKLTRRQLVASLSALVAGAPLVSSAQTAVPLAQVAQGRSLNHASLAVTDVERSARFYSTLLGLKEVSRPGNGGINLGLGSGFLGLYKLANPGHVNHVCIGVDNYDPEQIAARMKPLGVEATIDRNPNNRTSGGDQIYFIDPDNTRVQLAADGYQG